jgi:diguanylate cyclase (GGDEF)-like protein
METADVLRSTFRESDLVARVGGDEFCVLLSTKEDASPDVAVRRLLAEVAERNREPDRAYDLSVSLGMEVFDAEHPLPLETLMERADEKMYAHKRAKRAGTPLAAAAR